jgi:hypothetical protein
MADAQDITPFADLSRRRELTPSLKVKRAVVAEQNIDVLDALYT